MYLYGENDDQIEVFEMEPNKKKIAEFKKEEMESIPQEERVITAKTNSDGMRMLSNRDIGEQVYEKKLNQNHSGLWGGNSFHCMETHTTDEKENKRQQKLLKRYYDGDFTEDPVVLLKREAHDLKVLKYLLLTEKQYFRHGDILAMKNIISIPKSLYLLQLLEQGNFYHAADEDIQRQLETFDISDEPIMQISTSELKKMYDCKLIPGIFPAVMLNVKITQKILDQSKAKQKTKLK